MKLSKIFTVIKKYLWLIICIIWTYEVAAQARNEIWYVGKGDDIYTSANGYAYDSEKDLLYITDNIENSGFIYAINGNNSVTAMFNSTTYAKGTFCNELLLQDGRLYSLISAKTTQGDMSVKAYLIIELDPSSMEVVGRTDWFTTYEAINTCTIDKDDAYFYLTGISEDDLSAQVYAIPVGNLILASEDDNLNNRNVSTIRYSVMAQPTDGYHFVYASYGNGQLTTLENGKGILDTDIYNSLVRERFESKKLSAKQILEINRSYILTSILLCIIGNLFILFMYFIVRKRNRVAYLIVLWESMLAIVLLESSLYLYYWNREVDWTDVIGFATYALEDVRDNLDELEQHYLNDDNFYQTQEYQNITEEMRHAVHNYGDGEIFSNVLCVTVKNGDYHVITSSCGMDNCELEKVYGTDMISIVDAVRTSGKSQNGTVTIDGVEYSLVCFGSGKSEHPTATILAIVKAELSDEYYLRSIIEIFRVTLSLFVLGSVIGIFILLRQGKDLKLLGSTMLDVSQGGIGIEKPETLGEDMSDIWSGLMDIDRNFKNLNYIKYRTFESYYKFAPKSVEKLLDKTSITEVGSGDAVRKQGTIVMMETDTINMLKGLSKREDATGPVVLSTKAVEVLDAISRHQEAGDMFKISGTSDFSEMQLLMPDTTKNASMIGTELSRIYREEGHNACMFMHFTDYLYGVAIAGEEAAQFLLSKDIIMLRKNISILNELGVGQVITNTVYDREFEKPNCRHIGYWELDTEKRIELYEVLDAYDDVTRHHREDTKLLFEEGLHYFYEGSFSMARNCFANVLKLDYEDKVARWYLFTSENFIDGSGNKKDYSLSE